MYITQHRAACAVELSDGALVILAHLVTFTSVMLSSKRNHKFLHMKVYVSLSASCSVCGCVPAGVCVRVYTIAAVEQQQQCLETI